MGLAPYGKLAYLGEMRRIVRLMPDGTFKLDLNYFRHHTEEMPYQWENAAPQAGEMFAPALEELLDPGRRPEDPLEERHRDIAARYRRCMKRRSFT